MSPIEKLQTYKLHPEAETLVALEEVKQAVQPLLDLLGAVRTSEPILRYFENKFASSLSSDSRSHDEDRLPRRMVNDVLDRLKQCERIESK